MKKIIISTAIVTAGVLTGGVYASMRLPQSTTELPIGLQAVTGRVMVPIVPNAAGADGTLKLSGILHNRTGTDMRDLLVTITGPFPGEMTAPKLKTGSTNVSHNGPNGSSATAGASSPVKNSSGMRIGQSARINFGNGVDKLENNHTMNVCVTLEQAAQAGPMMLTLAPSQTGTAAGPDRHVDFLGQQRFTAKGKQAQIAMPSALNDCALVLISNASENRSKMTGLSGKATFAQIEGSDVELLDVMVCEPKSDEVIEGTSCTIEDGSFTITGFPTLKAKAECDLLMVFSAAPTNGYTLELSAQY